MKIMNSFKLLIITALTLSLNFQMDGANSNTIDQIGQTNEQAELETIKEEYDTLYFADGTKKLGTIKVFSDMIIFKPQNGKKMYIKDFSQVHKVHFKDGTITFFDSHKHQLNNNLKTDQIQFIDGKLLNGFVSLTATEVQRRKTLDDKNYSSHSLDSVHKIMYKDGTEVLMNPKNEKLQKRAEQEKLNDITQKSIVIGLITTAIFVIKKAYDDFCLLCY